MRPRMGRGRVLWQARQQVSSRVRRLLYLEPQRGWRRRMQAQLPAHLQQHTGKMLLQLMLNGNIARGESFQSVISEVRTLSW